MRRLVLLTALAIFPFVAYAQSANTPAQPQTPAADAEQNPFGSIEQGTVTIKKYDTTPSLPTLAIPQDQPPSFDNSAPVGDNSDQ
jgi:hypothetical protein